MFRSRSIALLLAVAVVFSAMLPFFATYSEKAPTSGLASLFGEKVLICTSEGFKWAKWEDLQAGKAPKSYKNYSCPLCYLADGLGKMLLAGGLAISLARFSRLQTSFELRTEYAFLRHSRAAHPRAPPRF